jgi:hypothetical protein
MLVQGGEVPGHAVVGEFAPGYAVVGGMVPGADPSPIGVATAGPAAAGGRGPYDRSVMPASVASDPLSPPGHNRPHVIGHLFGVTALGRDWRESRERRERESHASIPYGAPNQQVTELPAAMVYGRQ